MQRTAIPRRELSSQVRRSKMSRYNFWQMSEKMLLLDVLLHSVFFPQSLSRSWNIGFFLLLLLLHLLLCSNDTGQHIKYSLDKVGT